jgi:purine-binding chemotaxis protein CheW
LDYQKNEDADTEDMQTGRYLTFSIGDVMFGIEMLYITEIIGMQKITELPDMPDYMKGIINLRGKIIPVLDVRLLFGKEVREFDDRTCVIVIDIAGVPIGLIVDRVSEVVTIPSADVSDVPKASKGQNNRFVKNIGKTEGGVVLILDCEKLLNDQDISEITGLL